MSSLRKTFSDIADSIRQKGVEGEIKPVEMAGKIDSLETRRFGGGFDHWVGKMNNGTLTYDDTPLSIVFDGVETMGRYMLFSMFGVYDQMDGARTHVNVKSVSFPNLVTTGQLALDRFARHNANLSSIDFPQLLVINFGGMRYAFDGCTGLQSVRFPSLTRVEQSGLMHAFDGCTGLQSVQFPSLTRVENMGLYNTFSGCTEITSIELPLLTAAVATNSNPTLGVSQYCTSFFLPSLKTVEGRFLFSKYATEVHLGKANESALTASTGYSTKWGATNATIYFDL